MRSHQPTIEYRPIDIGFQNDKKKNNLKKKKQKRREKEKRMKEAR
jgi:hypothetical protein